MLLLVASLMTFSGCAKTKLHIQQTGSGQIAKYDQMQHYFFWGLGQSKTIKAGQICGGADKVVRVETQDSFLPVFLDWLTWGIYSPRQARVFCAP